MAEDQRRSAERSIGRADQRRARKRDDERVIADDRAMEVTRVRITEAGRRALAGRAK